MHMSSLNDWRWEWIAEHQSFQRDFETIRSLLLVVFENIMGVQGQELAGIALTGQVESFGREFWIQSEELEQETSEVC